MYTRITHITKPHPHDARKRIQEVGRMVGGIVEERYTLDEAIIKSERGDATFYVERGGRRVIAVVVPRGLLHDAYLRTEPDDIGDDNLLSLPQLPPRNALAGLLGAGAVRPPAAPTYNALAAGALRPAGAPVSTSSGLANALYKGTK